MVHKLARGLMIVALVFCIRAALAADASDITGDQIRAALKTLDSSTDRSALSRLTLAKAAMDSASLKAAKDPQASEDLYRAAQEVLNDAARLDPANKDVTDMLAQVTKHIPKTVTPPPATNPVTPATKPGPETKPATPEFIVKREVSQAEINRLRQIEWSPNENPKPSVRVDQDTRKKFIDASKADTPVAELNKLQGDALARAILDSGKEEFRTGVHLTTDPASLREFKLGVDTVIVKTCGNCHNSNKAGRFNLYIDKSDQSALYTNFLILQNYTTNVNGAVRLMVDRTTPEQSLLLQFMLPPALSDTPHPPMPANFVSPPIPSPVKLKSDPRYQSVLKWLNSLAPLAPNYGIDLTQPEPLPATPKK